MARPVYLDERQYNAPAARYTVFDLDAAESVLVLRGILIRYRYFVVFIEYAAACLLFPSSYAQQSRSAPMIDVCDDCCHTKMTINSPPAPSPLFSARLPPGPYFPSVYNACKWPCGCQFSISARRCGRYAADLFLAADRYQVRRSVDRFRKRGGRVPA